MAFSFFLSVFGISVESGQLQVLYIVLCSITYIYIAFKSIINRIVFVSVLRIAFVFAFIALLGVISTFLYPTVRYKINLELLSFMSTGLCCSCLTSVMLIENTSYKAYRLLPAFLFLSTVMLLITLIEGEVNVAHLINNSNAIDYQKGSYFAAYCLLLSLLCLTKKNGEEKSQKTRALNMFYFGIFMLSIFEILFYGGRGGFVLSIIGSLLVYLLNRKNIKSLKLIACCVVVFLGVIALSHLNVVGFNRIKSFFKSIGNDDRLDLYKKAIFGFYKSPVFGNGLGSVYYYVGYYSHNIFTDVLCDFGLLGLSIIVGLICAFYCKAFKWFRNNGNKLGIEFVVLFFTFGFVQSLFSGYFLSNHMLWVMVGFYVLPKSIVRLALCENNGGSGYELSCYDK